MLVQYCVYLLVFLNYVASIDNNVLPPSSSSSSTEGFPPLSSSSSTTTLLEGANILAALEGGSTNYKVNILPYGTTIKASSVGKYSYSYPMQSNGIPFRCYVEEDASKKNSPVQQNKPLARIALDNIVKTLSTDQSVEKQGCFTEPYGQAIIKFCPNQYMNIESVQGTSTNTPTRGGSEEQDQQQQLLYMGKAKYVENTDKLVTTADGNSYLEQMYSFTSSASSPSEDPRSTDTAASSSSSSEIFSLKVMYTCSASTRSLVPLFIQNTDYQSNNHHYSITVGTNDPSLCQSLPSIQRLLAPIHNVCLERVENWWTYELCIGNRLRQYHDENGKPVQESIIGIYDVEYGEKLQTVGVATAAAVLQHYHNGSPCDIRNGVPREAIVKYECMPNIGNMGSTPANLNPVGGVIGEGMHQLALLGIQEGPTCVYTFRIATALVCEYPDISPAKAVAVQAPPTNVLCIPSEEYDLYSDL